jgi:Skp family chaperone for outer membrane proteins
MPGPRRTEGFAGEVEDEVNNIFAQCAGRFQENQYELQMLVDKLESLLKDAKERLATAEKAASEFGTP